HRNHGYTFKLLRSNLFTGLQYNTCPQLNSLSHKLSPVSLNTRYSNKAITWPHLTTVQTPVVYAHKARSLRKRYVGQQSLQGLAHKRPPCELTSLLAKIGSGVCGSIFSIGNTPDIM